MLGASTRSCAARRRVRRPGTDPPRPLRLLNPPMRASSGSASSVNNSTRACISGPLTGGTFRRANPPLPRSILRSGATPTPTLTAPAIGTMPTPSLPGFPKRTGTAASQASCNPSSRHRQGSSRRLRDEFWCWRFFHPMGPLGHGGGKGPRLKRRATIICRVILGRFFSTDFEQVYCKPRHILGT